MPFLGTVSLGNEAVFSFLLWELLGNIGNY